MRKSESYLSKVKDQIKSKEAKEFVTAELENHLKEAKSDWIRKGFDEEQAEEKAVEQMGSPIIVGQQLNKLHRPKIDWLTVMLLITVLGFGFLPMFYLQNDYILGSYDAGYFTMRKSIFILLGIAVALGMMYIDYRKLARQGWLFYAIGVLILLAIHFLSKDMIYGIPVLEIGPITIEGLMAIPFFFLAWASFFNNSKLEIWHYVLLFLISCSLFFILPSVSTIYIYAVMVFVMLWWSRFSRKTILTMAGVMASSFLILGLIVWQSAGHYLERRILAFLNPMKDPDGDGYMMLLIKERMSNAGWFGNRVDNAIIPAAEVFIPDAHTNFVFVSLTYHYGWLLAAVLVLILSLFVVRMIAITYKINDSYGKLLLIGVVALYTIQFVSNIGMSFGFFPMTTMSLPFISYGLMPILLNAFLIGIVLSVYRRKDMRSFGFIEA